VQLDAECASRESSTQGGRNVLTHYGGLLDNYEVVFTYPGDVRFSFSSTQFERTACSMPVCAVWVGGFGDGSLLGIDRDYQQAGVEVEDSTTAAPALVLAWKVCRQRGFSDNLAFADRDKERTFIESITSGTATTRLPRAWRQRLVACWAAWQA